MMYETENKVVIVTGGADGIGAEIVKQFLDEGAKFLAIFDVNEEKGEALEKDQTHKHGPKRVKFYKCDVTDSGELNKCYEDILKTFSCIDVLVNNAGVLNDENFKKAVAINVTAVMENSLKAYTMMRKDYGGKGGTIVNISSIAALLNVSYVPVYNATKSAVLQFSLSLGAEDNYSRSGVRIVTVCFGVTDTSILDQNNLRFIDMETRAAFEEKQHERSTFTQTAESAAKGLIEAYKRGGSASTWLVSTGQPAKEITGDITQAYELMGKTVTS